jgi:2-keto-4-pentenoate hydratase/2-oxohepta-3-ene-1,7-dioic acid hydratase in catechol pathway
MKFVGYLSEGRTLIGVAGADGTLFPIAEPSEFYRDLPKSLAAAQKAAAGRGGVGRYEERPAVAGNACVFCVGVNYESHANEGRHLMPKDMPAFKFPVKPTIFSRWTRSLNANGGNIPNIETCHDWEGELAVVIGKEMRNVDQATAAEGILGYAVFNDVSARTYQLHTSQWTLGKNPDGSGVIGAIVTKDEVGDPAAGLRLTTTLNGTIMQDSSTAEMYYPIPSVIAYISEVMTLFPGDVIATGTPAGVGFARQPPLFMKVGDTIEVAIEKIGAIKNKVVAPADWKPNRL